MNLHEYQGKQLFAEYGLPDHLRVSVGLPEENERFLDTLERLLARS